MATARNLSLAPRAPVPAETQSADDKAADGKLSIHSLFAACKTSAQNEFEEFAQGMAIESGVQRPACVVSEPRGQYGGLVRQLPATEAGMVLDLDRSQTRKTLIEKVRAAVRFCDELKTGFEPQYLRGSTASYEPVKAACESLLQALMKGEECDDDDHTFEVARALVRLAAATDGLTNAMPESAFSETIRPRTGDEYLQKMGKFDDWIMGHDQSITSLYRPTMYPRSTTSLGDFSHMLRPSVFFKIAEYAGGYIFVRTILDPNGRMMGSKKHVKTAPEIMEIHIIESVGSGAGKMSCKDIKDIFMSLMDSKYQSGQTVFKVEDVSAREFSLRCEQALIKIMELESLAGGEVKERGDMGLSPFQNILLLLGNMPDSSRKNALQTLGNKYHGKAPHAFVTSGITALVTACVESRKRQPGDV